MSLKESFTGKTVLVTGAGKGIGRAICIRLHSYGAQVVALSRTASTLVSLEEECAGIRTVCVDLEKWDETRKAVEEIGPVDALVNNAGICIPKPFMEVTEQEFDSHFHVNLKAIVNVSQVVAKYMIKGGRGGSIVNISSLYAIRGVPSYSLYCTSKAGVDMLTKTMANELGKHKIRVNSVNPGAVLTPMIDVEAKSLGMTMEQYTQQYLEKVPYGVAFIPLDEIVNTVLFTLSNLAPLITGSNILIDGGYATA